MEFQFDLIELLGVAAAIPLALLGLFVLGLRERRSVNLAFAAFSITWALQIAVANLGRIAVDAATKAALFRGSILLLLATSLFLAWFASLHPQRNQVARHPRGMLLIALVPLAGFLLMLLQPDSLVRVVVSPDGTRNVALGPLVSYVSLPIFMAALVYAVVTQLVAVRDGATRTLQARARFVYLAIALFFSYFTTRNFLFFLSTWDFDLLDLATTSDVLFYGAGTLFALGLAGHLRRRSVRPHADWSMVLALLVPGFVAVLEWVLLTGGVTFESGWFWRLGAVALLAYAIARYQMFDLDLRFRRAALYAIPVGVGAFSVALLLALMSAPTNPVAMGGGMTLAVAGNVFAWLFRDRLANRFLLVGKSGEDYVDHRRLEVYRAALEDRYDAERDTWRDPEGLKKLRSRLGISENAHQVLGYAVARTTAHHNPSPVQNESGRLVLGRYRIDRLLGEGAHGRTLLAVDTKTGDEVAVKQVGLAHLGGRVAELLMREARILSRLEHPNIVRMIAAERDGEAAYLVMEYVDGGNLAGMLARRRRFSARETVAIAEQVLAGLQEAHDHGIIHRDLKGENILLARDGTVKLADFGIARESGPEATVATGLAGAGTLTWMSPEQVRGAETGPPSDLYAVGALVYRMLTGTHYIDLAGRDDFQVRQAILESPPRANDAVPAPLQAVIARALAKDPDARYPDAASLSMALKGAVQTPRTPETRRATITTTA